MGNLSTFPRGLELMEEVLRESRYGGRLVTAAVNERRAQVVLCLRSDHVVPTGFRARSSVLPLPPRLHIVFQGRKPAGVAVHGSHGAILVVLLLLSPPRGPLLVVGLQDRRAGGSSAGDPLHPRRQAWSFWGQVPSAARHPRKPCPSSVWRAGEWATLAPPAAVPPPPVPWHPVPSHSAHDFSSHFGPLCTKCSAAKSR